MRRLFEVAPLTRCDQPLSLGVKERVPGEVKRRGGHDQWRSSTRGSSGYDFAELVADYRVCLWITAVLYALPGVYDRGTTTDANAEVAKDVGLRIGQHLQPVLDGVGATGSSAHLQRHNRDTKSGEKAGGVGLLRGY